MKVIIPLIVIGVLAAVAFVGVEVLHLQLLFGTIIPYLALATFVLGFAYRIVTWGRSAVPFRITTTCGQQRSLPWIKQNKIENPSTKAGVLGRMLIEVLLFRSLFRNTNIEKKDGKLGIGSAKWLWLVALLFHWSLFFILLRHLQIFMSTVPAGLQALTAADAFLQIGLPTLFISDGIIALALTFLLLRRLIVAKIRYISLPADLLALFLLLAIVISGILMRYLFKVDMLAVKDIMIGLASLQPQTGASVGSIFYVHLFMVSVLAVYFPWSKLMHAGGIFFSPTRNMANNNRMQRHINPWDHPVETHTYDEYEDEFRSKMIKAGLPVERSE